MPVKDYSIPCIKGLLVAPGKGQLKPNDCLAVEDFKLTYHKFTRAASGGEFKRGEFVAGLYKAYKGVA